MMTFMWIALGLYALWRVVRYAQGVAHEREQAFVLTAPTFRELSQEAHRRLRFDHGHDGWQRPVWVPLRHPPLTTCLTDRMTCYIWRKDDTRAGIRRWTMVVWLADRKNPWTLTFLGDQFRYGNIGGVDGPRCDAEALTPYELKLVNEFGRLVLGAFHASAYA